MSKMFQVYGIGQALIPVLPPPLNFQTAPNVNQTNYEIGQMVYTGTPGNYTFYLYAGAGVWELLDVSSGVLDSLTTDDNTVVVPTAGNINIKGSGSTTTVGSGSNATVELTGLTNHAVLVGAGTTTITKVGPTATAGQVLQSQGLSADPAFSTATFPATAGTTGTILRSNGTNWVNSSDTWPDAVTTGGLIAATGTNIVGQIDDVAVGQVLASGGVGVIPAYTATPSVTSVTTANGFTATVAGAGITLNSAATSGTTTATLNGRSGQVTITTPTINAGATFTMTIANTSITGSSTQVLYGLTGGTTGSAITIQSVTNSANQSAVVVQNASAVTNSTGSLVLTFLVLN
jgi:hypothetical protein